MDILPSEAVQKIIVSANLNSTLLFLFLMGVYGGVYARTLYTYSALQNPVRRGPIITVLSALYVVIFSQGSIQWYYVVSAFVTKGDTRLSIFEISSGSFSPFYFILSDVLSNITLLLADGLLVCTIDVYHCDGYAYTKEIWRCFHVCAGSWCRILVPLFLFGLEFVICIADSIFNALLILRPYLRTESRVIAFGIVDGFVQALAVVTSVVATSIIGRNIWASINRDGASNRRHCDLLDIFIQTSAIYCLSLVGNATCSFLLSALGDIHGGKIVFAVSDYMLSINLIITGLAPTLMVARLTKKMKEQKEAFSSNDTGHQFVSYPEGHPTTNSDGILGPEITAGQDESTRITEASEVV